MAKHCPVTGKLIDRCDCGGCEPDEDETPAPFEVKFTEPPWPSREESP